MEDIKVTVKYCGGCNPYFERGKAARAVSSKLGIELTAYNEDDIPDIVLIICGCKSECIEVKAYKSKLKTIVLNDIEGIDEVLNIILKLITESG